MNKECAIIDTCVLLTDPAVITRAEQIGFPVLTKIVFDEIDYNKRNSNADTAKNASLIFRKIKHQAPEKQDVLPCGKALLDGDTLFKYEFDGAPLFVIMRNVYRTKRTNFDDTNTYNDATIREVAKDYDLILVTEDGGNKILADLDKIRATVWTPKTRNRRTPKAVPGESSPSVRPFRRTTSILQVSGEVRHPQGTPGKGDTVTIGQTGPSVQLGTSLGRGGEGQVFELIGSNRVAKIYHGNQLTANRIAKLELMASRSVSLDGICWPEKLVYSPDGSPVGYVMQRAHGHPLQKSVFLKPLLSQRFPKWQRENLINVCISFLEKIEYLHALNVLVGDINPMNVLVTGDGTNVFIVDADSFQVEGFPCPVGTVNFSPPHLQNKNFKSLLRTEEDELFAAATMLFMILVTGKAPYSQQGGESPEKNIINANFPYPLGDDHKSRNVSAGPWRFIWSHLPYRLKELFHKTFRENNRIATSEWLNALRAYKNDITKGYLSNDIFPAGLKVPKDLGETVTCSRPGCGKRFELFKDKVAELKEHGQTPICPSCLHRLELERLAKSSSATKNSIKRKPNTQEQWRNGFPHRSASSKNKSPTTSSSATSRMYGRSKNNTSKRSAKKQAGMREIILIAAMIVLGLTMGWKAIPVIFVLLVIVKLLD